MLKIPKRPKYPKYVATFLVTAGLSVGTAFAVTKTGNELMIPRAMWPSNSQDTEMASDSSKNGQVKSEKNEKNTDGNTNGDATATDSQAAPAASGSQAGAGSGGAGTTGSTYTPGRGGGTTTTSPTPTTTTPTAPLPVGGGSGGGSSGGDECLCETLTQPIDDASSGLPVSPQTIVPSAGLSLWLIGRKLSRKIAFRKVQASGYPGAR